MESDTNAQQSSVTTLNVVERKECIVKTAEHFSEQPYEETNFTEKQWNTSKEMKKEFENSATIKSESKEDKWSKKKWASAIGKSLAYILSFGALSLMVTPAGWAAPTFVQKTGVTTKETGFILFGAGIGHIIGAIVFGKLIEWFRETGKKLPFKQRIKRLRYNQILGTVILSMALVNIAVPLVNSFTLIVVLFGYFGFCRGAIAVSSNLLLTRLWRKKVGPWLQANVFVYGIVGIISPLVAAPVLQTGSSELFATLFWVASAICLVPSIMVYMFRAPPDNLSPPSDFFDRINNFLKRFVNICTGKKEPENQEEQINVEMKEDVIVICAAESPNLEKNQDVEITPDTIQTSITIPEETHIVESKSLQENEEVKEEQKEKQKDLQREEQKEEQTIEQNEEQKELQKPEQKVEHMEEQQEELIEEKKEEQIVEQKEVQTEEQKVEQKAEQTVVQEEEQKELQKEEQIEEQKEEIDEAGPQIPSRSVSIVVSLVISLYIGIFVGAEFAYSGLITTMVTTQKGLTNQSNASLMLSTWSAANCLGRLCMIILTTRMGPKLLMFVGIIGALMSTIIMLIWNRSLLILWIFTGVIGFFKAPHYSCAISVPTVSMNLKVTGGMMTAFICGSATGVLIVPLTASQLSVVFGENSLLWIQLIAWIAEFIVFLFVLLISNSRKEIHKKILSTIFKII